MKFGAAESTRRDGRRTRGLLFLVGAVWAAVGCQPAETFRPAGGYHDAAQSSDLPGVGGAAGGLDAAAGGGTGGDIGTGGSPSNPDGNGDTAAGGSTTSGSGGSVPPDAAGADIAAAMDTAAARNWAPLV